MDTPQDTARPLSQDVGIFMISRLRKVEKYCMAAMKEVRNSVRNITTETKTREEVGKAVFPGASTEILL